MSLIGPQINLFGEALPKAYGGCTCDCHRGPGVKHVMACCYPGKRSASLLNAWDIDEVVLPIVEAEELLKEIS